MIKQYWDRDLSRDQNRYVADTELVSNMVGDLLGNPYFVERMGARNDGAWKRFVTALKLAHDGKAGGLSKSSQKYLSGLYKAYVRAVDDAGRGVKISAMVDDEEKEKALAGNSAADERDSKQGRSQKSFIKEVSREDSARFYSFSEAFKKRIDAWDEKTEGFSFVLGETPSCLSNLEVGGKRIGQKQVRLDATKVKTILKSHPEMTKEVIKELPNLLASPVLILDSKTVPGRLVLLGEVYAKNKPVMMVLELNPTTRSGKTSYMDVIKIASAYARSNVQNIINTSTIRFVDQNESRVDNWLKVNRLQLPLPNSQLVSANNSIPQNSEKSTENAKKVSNERQSKKTYRRADASAVIDQVVSEHLIFDDVYGEMKGKTKKEATSILWKALNTAEPGKRGVAALRVADYVIDNAVAKTFGEDPNVEINAKTLSVLKPYLRKLDLDGIKGEIANRFGKQNAIHLVWGKREGDVGVAPDAIKRELNEQGVIIEANNPPDIFFEIYDLYNEAKEGLERSARALLKNGLTSEERETLRQEIAKDLHTASFFLKKQRVAASGDLVCP